MNLQPMNPPARDGQRVVCVECGRMTGSPLADLDAPAGTFYCRDCAPEPRASVPDPVADTARALAGLWTKNDREWTDALMGRIPLATANEMYTDRALAIEDAARTCGSQVYAAFCALVTGDAGREVGNG